MQVSKQCISIGFLLSIVTVALDQFSKWLVLAKFALPQGQGMEVLPVFNIVLVWNHGISFGMFAEHRQPMLLLLMSVVIVGMLLIWLFKTTNKVEAAALGLVIGGALGNDIDRMRLDAVVDFLDFHWAQYHWPAFNIADSCIFIGVVLLCGGSMFSKSTN